MGLNNMDYCCYSFVTVFPNLVGKLNILIIFSCMELFFLVASQNQRARHRNVIFDGIAGDSQCKYLNTPAT